VIGALAQDVFFALTKKLAPVTPKDVFDPPEPEQRTETATQTVARRVVEDVLERGPLTRKERAGRLVHYAFGATWGGAYGLLASSFASPRTLRGGVTFGLAVWLLSDDILLPAFRLAAWPHHYPVKTHVYAVAAHVVYGAAAWGTFRAVERQALPASAWLGARWLTRNTPALLQSSARRLSQRALYVALPLRQAATALGVG
jgi:hypothetical protein